VDLLDTRQYTVLKVTEVLENRNPSSHKDKLQHDTQNWHWECDESKEKVKAIAVENQSMTFGASPRRIPSVAWAGEGCRCKGREAMTIKQFFSPLI
jgi:hypothetical protein